MFGEWCLEAETWRLMRKNLAWKIYWTQLIDLAGTNLEGRRDNDDQYRSKDMQLVSPWLSYGKRLRPRSSGCTQTGGDIGMALEMA